MFDGLNETDFYQKTTTIIPYEGPPTLGYNRRGNFILSFVLKINLFSFSDSIFCKFTVNHFFFIIYFILKFIKFSRMFIGCSWNTGLTR